MTSYLHKHHIIPKHAGGTDDASNIVELTIEEHAAAHKKLYEQYGRWQDKVAWLALSKSISGYEATQMARSESMKARVYTDEIRANMSRGQTGKKMPAHEVERRKKSVEHLNGFYGKKHSESFKQAQRERNLGKKLSEETRRKMSESKKGIPKPKETCPHCGRVGGRPQMLRHHFDNCKQKALREN